MEVAGVAAFFGASTACAAFVNRVSDGIAQQLADFGADLGLVVPLADNGGIIITNRYTNL